MPTRDLVLRGTLSCQLRSDFNQLSFHAANRDCVELLLDLKYFLSGTHDADNNYQWIFKLALDRRAVMLEFARRFVAFDNSTLVLAELLRFSDHALDFGFRQAPLVEFDRRAVLVLRHPIDCCDAQDSVGVQ